MQKSRLSFATKLLCACLVVGAALAFGCQKDSTQPIGDTTPPATVANLAAGQPTQAAIVLTWTAPGDDGTSGTATQYDIRYSTALITSANWASATTVTSEPTPAAAGSAETFTATGLQPATPYYFAIKTADEVPNWSDLSNVPNGTTLAPTDTTPPAKISDLAAGTDTDTSIILTWTAPGDDGSTGTAAQYDIRYSMAPITSDNWGSATAVTGEPTPAAAGSTESFTVAGLQPDTPYYFAIETADEVPNWSALSNVPTASTGVTPDTTPPSFVADLAATNPTLTTLDLSWTAPGDDGNTGTASEYDIRYSQSPITSGNWASALQATGEPVPSAAGTAEAFTLAGLQSGTHYYIAIKTADEVPNWSALSNVAEGTTQVQTPPGFVLVPAGTFTMGSPPDEPGRQDDEVQHEVELTRSFFICEHEVTQAEWLGYMLWNDSESQNSGYPVGYVTWYDCLSYCNKRSAGEGLDSVYALTYRVYQDHHIVNATVSIDANKNGYRLPTEAQWEYACRAGSTTAFCNGGITNTECHPIEPNLAMVGWYCGNNQGDYHFTEMLLPNNWGIYDMHGNVLEWCMDAYGAYSLGHVVDPLNLSGAYHVFRGGSISNYARWCRSAMRSWSSSQQGGNLGLRVIRYAP